MLAELFPRVHAHYLSLPVLGPYLDGFVTWLQTQGYPRAPICRRIRATRRLDGLLAQRGLDGPENLTAALLQAFAPRDSQDDVYLSAVVRSLRRYFSERGFLARPKLRPHEHLVAEYRGYLERVRGLAGSTMSHHGTTAAEFLVFLGFDSNPKALRQLDSRGLGAFVSKLGRRMSRPSLQHAIAYVRSFLRFLASRGALAPGLDTTIDTPRVYRGEQLPRSLPWEVVQAFLAAIDRSTPMGCRDYAMFLLIATYGLRISEVARLCLDDIEWRAGRLRVGRPKNRTPLILPLTEEVGAALLDYLRRGRPDLPDREIFLRVRAPAGPLKHTAVNEAFQGCRRRSALPIPHKGPHCLRHSLAVHLLREGASLKAIGDLLGHRSLESTCVYLRLHVADLRDAALELPRVTLS